MGTGRTVSVDNEYFNWLYKKIGPITDRNPSHSHFMLAEQLHQKTFKWSVPNDDNRVVEGMLLRDEFEGQFGRDIERYRFQHIVGTCSVFEMLIALTARVEFEANGFDIGFSFGDWFWILMDNLGLKHFTDERYLNDEGSSRKVNAILNKLIGRTYRPNGVGGLFPLRHPDEDQRDVELWYQMSAYLQEHCDFNVN